MIKKDLSSSQHRESFNSSFTDKKSRKGLEDSRRDDSHNYINFKGKVCLFIIDQQNETSNGQFIILGSENMDIANYWTCVINYFITK
jgi:hypothetical protein